jgi:hypothetical protein
MKAIAWTVMAYWIIGCVFAGLIYAPRHNVSDSSMFTAAAMWPAIGGAYLAKIGETSHE